MGKTSNNTIGLTNNLGQSNTTLAGFSVAKDAKYTSSLNSSLTPNVSVGYNPELPNIASQPNKNVNKLLTTQHTGLNRNSYCTDCAEDLMHASGNKGKIVIFGSKDAKWSSGYHWGLNETSPRLKLNIKGGKSEEYTYHSVYTDGKYFYDPFVSNNPIPQSDYIKMLKNQNSNGISWRIKGESNSPRIPDLKKSNF